MSLFSNIQKQPPPAFFTPNSQNNEPNNTADSSQNSYVEGSGSQMEFTQQGSQLEFTQQMQSQVDFSELGGDEATRFGGGEELSKTMPPPKSPPQPWGKLIPNIAGRAQHDLLPKKPSSPANANTNAPNAQYQVCAFGDFTVNSGDVFNEFVIGRSAKCDVVLKKPSSKESNNEDTIVDIDKEGKWVHTMLSNRHCKIYCLNESSSHQSIHPSSPPHQGTRRASKASELFEHPQWQPLCIFELHALRYARVALLHEAIFV